MPRDVTATPHRILVCAGRLCQGRGSPEVWREWRRWARQTDAVVLRTSCLGHCVVGPMVVVYPDGVWLTRQTRETAATAERALERRGPWPDHLRGAGDDE